MTVITERQQREIAYHRDYAAEHENDALPSLKALDPTEKFRWWNAYWVILRRAQRLYRPGAKALVIGCGFGDDAIQLAAIGYSVEAIDLSPESVAVAERRAKDYSANFHVSPAETLPFPDNSFDLVYFPDVIHHVDIPASMREAKRVLKPSGRMLANEPYTHSLAERVRQSWLVRQILYPRLVRQVYGTDKPYITEDERKLTERDIRQIADEFHVTRQTFFLLLSGRIFPTTIALQAKIDRAILKTPPLGYFLSGRVVLEATKSATY